jgi:hypothetical protein
MLVLSDMCNIYSGPIWALVKVIRARIVLCFPELSLIVTGAATVLGSTVRKYRALVLFSMHRSMYYINIRWRGDLAANAKQKFKQLLCTTARSLLMCQLGQKHVQTSVL